MVRNGLIALASFICLQACHTANARYTDYSTGLPFELVKDATTGLMVDKETGKPLSIYIDHATSDTINGRTGKIINRSANTLLAVTN